MASRLRPPIKKWYAVPSLDEPAIIIYDRYTGGLGFARTGYDLIDTWLDMCRAMVRECPCTTGCPSCVGLVNLRPPLHHAPDLGTGYPVPNKEATVLLLEGLKQLQEQI